MMVFGLDLAPSVGERLAKVVKSDDEAKLCKAFVDAFFGRFECNDLDDPAKVYVLNRDTILRLASMGKSPEVIADEVNRSKEVEH